MANRQSAQQELIESILDPDPLVQCRRWYDEAVAAGLPQPNAMTLATATRNGAPSARIVLMKNLDSRGITFYSNYRSRKGAELEDNPRAALIFYWEQLNRQVRLEGRVEKVSEEESDAYFRSRPLENKLSSAASPQSQVVTREELDRRYDDLRRQYEGHPIPRPGHWGGYRVVPHQVEFWQRRVARLNDRITYEKRTDGGWKILRLAP